MEKPESSGGMRYRDKKLPKPSEEPAQFPNRRQRRQLVRSRHKRRKGEAVKLSQEQTREERRALSKKLARLTEIRNEQ